MKTLKVSETASNIEHSYERNIGLVSCDEVFIRDKRELNGNQSDDEVYWCHVFFNSITFPKNLVK